MDQEYKDDLRSRCAKELLEILRDQFIEEIENEIDRFMDLSAFDEADILLNKNKEYQKLDSMDQSDLLNESLCDFRDLLVNSFKKEY